MLYMVARKREPKCHAHLDPQLGMGKLRVYAM